jgi:hypothetical protein
VTGNSSNEVTASCCTCAAITPPAVVRLPHPMELQAGSALAVKMRNRRLKL